MHIETLPDSEFAHFASPTPLRRAGTQPQAV
jgi:hypothetical protein